ncbi:LacI family DNA-binding transcriptional regulator [Gulosibacter chungangensis]|uniref:LacI family transcriptional regulator n=1 Tax=Gulosibacter chungangensis TaxID=979746 RepID=A0A7J5BAH8_9MICO|nr:LacI family DNA-binding transcriptional regulator [Gulosibacter chungangensis]KAB1642249.1 LacI family transcriptional regulator [Gulosibacter chungangensis]
MSAKGQPVTLGEVAKAAGVSIATASRAINGSTRRVSEDIRKRVQETADRLGYLPNLSAQAVAKGASSTVAVVVSDIADPFFSAIAAGVMRGANEAGLVVTLAAADHTPQNELDIVRTFRSQRPRAIILSGSRSVADPNQALLDEQLEAFASTGGKVVLISQSPSPFDVVELANREGARELARVLVERGGQRFGIVTGPQRLMTNRDRVAGFREGLEESGTSLETDAVVEAEFSRDGGYTGLRTLLSRVPEVDTIFATSDVMAIGAMTALRDLGKTPGKDISIAGFDDIDTARDVTPTLTTVVAPLADMGYRAVKLAIDPDAARDPQVLKVNTSVIVRESTPVRERASA